MPPDQQPPQSADVDMNISDEEQKPHTEPPARLASRFHRKSTSRRSSTHSSRRSSLSSRHSRTSALSCHGGPYSTHIAQHLRRASIIESRKARLAERAAHAEQVRLRAAAAKAAPRTSNSEEKALAAQAAREKLLAEITARCEEEVRRAKRIAEETKEKKAAEHARLRDEMAEKFAVAARRRSMYQLNSRRPRTTSLAAVEEKKIDPVQLKKLSQSAAAKVIQRQWRASYKRRIANAFISLNINLPHLQSLEFGEVTRLISEESTISATEKLLRYFRMLDQSNDDTANRGAVRVFLSAFMIVVHPVQTFSHGGKEGQEQELVLKGSALVEAASKKIEAMAAPIDIHSISEEQLQFLFNDFTSAFHAWKSQDLGVLVDVMVGSFVNLDLILQTTKDDQDGHVAEDYLQAVRQEQIKILARLKRLAGSENALNRVRTAVRKARKERASQHHSPSDKNVPRASTPTEMEIDITPAVPLTPPATPPRHSRRPDERATSFLSRLGETMTVLPSNREIAHEMQINGTFEVQQQPWTDARKQFMDSLRRSMRESMQNGGKQAEASWTHAMAVLIREKLMNLVTPRHPLYDRIDGFLDPRLIDQQCRNGAFSYTNFFETIANLIAQICSPGRDEAVRDFSQDTTSDTISRLFGLINILDLMTLDHINFQFRMATRSVIEHGHEHEHSMFEKALQDGMHTLDIARRWWASAKRNVSPSSVAPSAFGSAIYARGLTDLVLSNTPLKYSEIPETLRLDHIRLLKIRARAFHVVATSSILLTSKIRLRRNREALWTREAERLMKLDLMNTDVSRIVSLMASSHMMPENTKQGLHDFVSRVLPSAVVAADKWKSAEQHRQEAIQGRRNYSPSAVETSIGDGDIFIEQIATFLLKSLREHVFARLSATSTTEKVRVTTGAPETLARIGMPEFVTEVGGIVDILERIRSVDLKAHEKWYDDIASSSTAIVTV